MKHLSHFSHNPSGREGRYVFLLDKISSWMGSDEEKEATIESTKEEFRAEYDDLGQEVELSRSEKFKNKLKQTKLGKFEDREDAQRRINRMGDSAHELKKAPLNSQVGILRRLASEESVLDKGDDDWGYEWYDVFKKNDPRESKKAIIESVSDKALLEVANNYPKVALELFTSISEEGQYSVNFYGRDFLEMQVSAAQILPVEAQYIRLDSELGDLDLGIVGGKQTIAERTSDGYRIIRDDDPSQIGKIFKIRSKSEVTVLTASELPEDLQGYTDWNSEEAKDAEKADANMRLNYYTVQNWKVLTQSGFADGLKLLDPGLEDRINTFRVSIDTVGKSLGDEAFNQELIDRFKSEVLDKTPDLRVRSNLSQMLRKSAFDRMAKSSFDKEKASFEKIALLFQALDISNDVNLQAIVEAAEAKFLGTTDKETLKVALSDIFFESQGSRPSPEQVESLYDLYAEKLGHAQDREVYLQSSEVVSERQQLSAKLIELGASQADIDLIHNSDDFAELESIAAKYRTASTSEDLDHLLLKAQESIETLDIVNTKQDEVEAFFTNFDGDEEAKKDFFKEVSDDVALRIANRDMAISRMVKLLAQSGRSLEDMSPKDFSQAVEISLSFPQTTIDRFDADGNLIAKVGEAGQEVAINLETEKMRPNVTQEGPMDGYFDFEIDPRNVPGVQISAALLEANYWTADDGTGESIQRMGREKFQNSLKQIYGAGDFLSLTPNEIQGWRNLGHELRERGINLQAYFQMKGLLHGSDRQVADENVKANARSIRQDIADASALNFNFLNAMSKEEEEIA